MKLGIQQLTILPGHHLDISGCREEKKNIVVHNDDKITSNGITFSVGELCDIENGNVIPHILGLFTIFSGNSDEEVNKVCKQINMNTNELILWGIMNNRVKSENIQHFVDIGYVTRENLDTCTFLGFDVGGN